jgi:hypothetical protein
LTLTVADIFTPSNEFSLDQHDRDLGSGGVMVLPDQPGSIPHVSVAAGKDGRMFILNRDYLRGFQGVDVPNNVNVDACWCGPSYYKGADGVGRIVSSGGSQIKTWKVKAIQIAAIRPGITLEAATPSIF